MAAVVGLKSHSIPKEDLDFLVRTIKEEDPLVVKQRLMRMVVEAVCNPIRQQYERESSLNYQYIENDFYTPEELADFAERGQPPTRRNEIAPVMEKLAGQFIQTRQTVTFLGRNTPADDTVGAISQDLLRWNDQRNMYEFEEQDICWHGLVGGVGWEKHWIKEDELGNQYECVRSIDPYCVFKDRYSKRYNPNDDAKYIVEGSWMDLEDVIAIAPDKEEEIVTSTGRSANYAAFNFSNVDPSLLNDENALTGAMYGVSVSSNEKARSRVRPFEVWYKRKVAVYHLYQDDKVIPFQIPLTNKLANDVMKQMGGRNVDKKKKYIDRMYNGFMIGDLVVHHDITPHWHNLFPYVPFYSGMRKNGCPLSLAARLVPINEIINKLEAKSINLATTRQALIEEQAVKDEDEFTTELQKSDGLMVVESGALSGQAPKIVIRDNMEMSQGHLTLLQEAKDAVRRCSGQGNEAMGMPSEVRSGTGIARKQMMGNLVALPVQNNLKHTRMLRAHLSYAHLKQYTTPEMAFQITDDMNVAKTVKVTQNVLSLMKEREYDLIPVETKDYTTLREQQVEMLLTVLPQLGKLGPGFVALGIQLTDLREKDALIKNFQAAMQTPPNMPKMSLSFNWSDLTPEMQAFLAFKEMQSPELAQAIMQKMDDPAYLKKLKAEVGQTMIREGTRATVERGKLDLSAMSTAIDGRMQLRQLFADQDAMEADRQAQQSSMEEPA